MFLLANVPEDITTILAINYKMNGLKYGQQTITFLYLPKIAQAPKSIEHGLYKTHEVLLWYISAGLLSCEVDTRKDWDL